jgi:hypothetical protein
MTPQFTPLRWILPLIALLYGCSRSPTAPVVKHHWDERSGDWIIELPESASDQEILSNFFSVLLLQNGTPIPGIFKYVEFTGPDGKVIAAVTNSVQEVQKIGHYSIVDQKLGWCGADEPLKLFTLDTDQGRKWVTIDVARNHSADPKATGWRCHIEALRTNGY